jgi:hypothetical protein
VDKLELTTVEDRAENDAAAAAPVLKIRVVLPRDDAKRVRRGVQSAAIAGIGLVPVCLACREAGKGHVALWTRDPQTGELRLECEEHVRLFEGVRG